MADQKVAIVSGGTYGIGRAITVKLASRGYDVVAFNRGLLWRQTGDLEEALAAFGSILERRGDAAKVIVEVGATHQLMGQRAAAMASYDEAISLSPEEPSYFFKRGILHYEMGRPELAMADYDRAIELAPGNTNSRYNRAVLRAETGDFRGAIDDLNLVLRSTSEEGERREIEATLHHLETMASP